MEYIKPQINRRRTEDVVSLVSFIPQIIRCKQEVEENQSTFINCCWSACRVGGGWVRGSLSHQWERGAELMHAWVPSPSPTQNTSKKKIKKSRDHHNRGVPTHTGPCGAYIKGLERMLCVWSGWGAVCGGAGWVQRSMKVLSFNMSHMWEAPTGHRKAAKRGPWGCSRCEISHFPFYYLPLHVCEHSNDARRNPLLFTHLGQNGSVL